MFREKKIVQSVILLFAITCTGAVKAGCTKCTANADGEYSIDYPNVCPGWCCIGGLAYTVTPGGQGPAAGETQDCHVGAVGCIHGDAGCAAPCGCS